MGTIGFPEIQILPVEAHRCQDECGAGQRDTLKVRQDFTQRLPQHPLAEGHKQDLRGHRAEADGEVPYGQVDDEDVHSAVPLPVPAAGQEQDDGGVADQGANHAEHQGSHALDHSRRPDLLLGVVFCQG